MSGDAVPHSLTYPTVPSPVSSLRDRFCDVSVLVVGDLMLDRYIYGSVHRVSPEAPVPVVREGRRREMPGGMGNAAANLANLGVAVTAVAAVGDDISGARLRQLLEKTRISTDHLCTLTDAPTITKSRVVAEGRQMIRFDREECASALEPHAKRIQRHAERALKEDIDVVVLSDYQKGALTPETSQHIISVCRDQGIPVIVDPKGTDGAPYRGATVLAPNEKELCALTGLTRSEAESLDVLEAAGHAFRKEFQIAEIMATRGEHGIMHLHESGTDHYATRRRDVFNVSGAGDTVTAMLAACRGGGVDTETAIQLANTAAGIVVTRTGTAPITLDDLDAELHPAPKNIYRSLHELEKTVAQWRADGETIGFTNGCFDLIHVGHVTYLRQAASMCDRLIVGINSDDSVRRLKGAERPVVKEENRSRVIAALEGVDAVRVFDEDTPLNLINVVRPHLLMKGGDYQAHEIVGGPEVRSWGGDVTIIPYVGSFSTTSLIDRCRMGRA